MSNIDKIRQEIERRKNKFYKKLPRACYPESCNSKEEERAIGIYGELTDLLSFIDSLSEEKPSLPDNLDEAAEKYANRGISSNADPYEETIAYQADKDAFKAGAEWMAEQGETQGHFVIGSIADSPCGPAVVCYTEEFAIGDQVIVQIRKKEENHE